MANLQNENSLLVKLTTLALFGFLLYFSLLGAFSEAFTIGPNYRNISVDTTVNITNAGPEVLFVDIENPITLTAGGTQTITCNVSIRDYNSFGDIDTVNATLFHNSTTYDAALNNNTLYRNSSCTAISESGIYANYSCSFDVYYYANAANWTCITFVNDSFSFVGNSSNETYFNELLALNVTPLIDYGDLAVEDTSANMTANITNFGNQEINISVYGYGATAGDGLAMVCDQGNISIENQKFSVSIADDYAAKTALAASSQLIPGLTMPKQSVPGTQIENTTYWQLYVPPNPFGICNGTIVFQAESST